MFEKAVCGWGLGIGNRTGGGGVSSRTPCALRNGENE